jgi:hypothetical protein
LDAVNNRRGLRFFGCVDSFATGALVKFVPPETEYSLTENSTGFNGLAALHAAKHRIEERHSAANSIVRGAGLLIISAVLGGVFLAFRQDLEPADFVATVVVALLQIGVGASLWIYRSRFLAAIFLVVTVLDLASSVLLMLQTGHFSGVGLVTLAGAVIATSGTFRLARIEQRVIIWSAIAWNCLAFLAYTLVLEVGLAAWVRWWMVSFDEITAQIISAAEVYFIPLALLVLVAIQVLPFTRRNTSTVAEEIAV